MKRVVQVDEPQQMMQRALADEEARMRQRAVAARIEIDEPPVAQRRGRQQRAPVRPFEDAAGQREACPAATALLVQSAAQRRHVRVQFDRGREQKEVGLERREGKRRAHAAQRLGGGVERRRRPLVAACQRVQSRANGRDVVTQCMARRVDGLWTSVAGHATTVTFGESNLPAARPSRLSAPSTLT